MTKFLKPEDLSPEQQAKLKQVMQAAAKEEKEWFESLGVSAAEILEGSKVYQKFVMAELPDTNRAIYWSPIARKMFILGHARGRHVSSSTDKNITGQSGTPTEESATNKG